MATPNDVMLKIYNAWLALDSSFFCGLSTITPAWAADPRLLAKKSPRRTPQKNISRSFGRHRIDVSRSLQLVHIYIHKIRHSITLSKIQDYKNNKINFRILQRTLQLLIYIPQKHYILSNQISSSIKSYPAAS